MKSEDRLKKLEQLSQKQQLSQIEEDELYELLIKFDKLDDWLDSNIIDIASSKENLIYKDKEFLKSIAEPPINIRLDSPSVYENKEKLYKKGIRYNLFVISSIAAVMAMVTWFVIQPNEDLDHNVDVYSYIIEKSKIEEADIKTKIVKSQDLDIKRDNSNKQRSKINKQGIEIKVKNIEKDKLIKASNIQPTPLEPQQIVEVEDASEKLIEPELCIVNTTPPDVILYANAAKWEESIDTDDIIINHEEWADSETRPRRRLKGFMNKMKDVKYNISEKI